jgi:hypothetical protein
MNLQALKEKIEARIAELRIQLEKNHNDILRYVNNRGYESANILREQNKSIPGEIIGLQWVLSQMEEEDNGWVSVEDRLPKVGQLVDIWIEEPRLNPRRRTDYVFTGSTKIYSSPEFQEAYEHSLGVYTNGYYISENIVKYWMPTPNPKQN